LIHLPSITGALTSSVAIETHSGSWAGLASDMRVVFFGNTPEKSQPGLIVAMFVTKVLKRAAEWFCSPQPREA
jgi:hypothetical protein